VAAADQATADAVAEDAAHHRSPTMKWRPAHLDESLAVIGGGLTRVAAEAVGEGRTHGSGRPSITMAEAQVLRYLFPNHCPFSVIADKLGISRSAAKERAAQLYKRLGVHTRDEAVSRARSPGPPPRQVVTVTVARRDLDGASFPAIRATIGPVLASAPGPGTSSTCSARSHARRPFATRAATTGFLSFLRRVRVGGFSLRYLSPHCRKAVSGRRRSRPFRRQLVLVAPGPLAVADPPRGFPSSTSQFHNRSVEHVAGRFPGSPGTVRTGAGPRKTSRMISRVHRSPDDFQGAGRSSNSAPDIHAPNIVPA